MSYILALFLVCFIIFIFSKGEGQGVGRYAQSVMLGLTQLFNILTGGHPDQSFSGRCGILREQGSRFFTIIANLLDAIFKLRGEEDHCRRAIEYDRPALVNYERSIKTLIQYVIMLLFVYAIGYLLSNNYVCAF